MEACGVDVAQCSAFPPSFEHNTQRFSCDARELEPIDQGIDEGFALGLGRAEACVWSC